MLPGITTVGGTHAWADTTRRNEKPNWSSNVRAAPNNDNDLRTLGQKRAFSTGKETKTVAQTTSAIEHTPQPSAR